MIDGRAAGKTIQCFRWLADGRNQNFILDGGNASDAVGLATAAVDQPSS
jgi:hypothetical protein